MILHLRENKVDCSPSIEFWLLVFGLLEVWIWIEKEHLGQLAFLKEIGQIPERRHLSQRSTERRVILHSVGAKAGNIGVPARMLRPKRSDSVGDIVRHLHPDLHAHHQGVREHGTQLDKQTPITTT